MVRELNNKGYHNRQIGFYTWFAFIFKKKIARFNDVILKIM